MSKCQQVKIGDLCQVRQDKKEAKKTITDGDFVSFIPMDELGIRDKSVSGAQFRSLGEVYSGYTYFAENDVLLAKITPCFQNGKLGVARGLKNGIGFGSSEFFVLRCDERLLPDFLFYYLSQDDFIEGGVASMGGAVGHQRVPPEYVLGCSIPLPPLSEQRRIVSVLDAAFAGLATATANTQKNLQNARELFDSSLNTVFTSSQNGWNVSDLSDVVASNCSLSYGIVQPGEDREDGLPIVRPTDLGRKIITPTGLKRIDPSRADSYSRTTLKGADLLLCVRGTTGTLSIASEALAGANVTRGIVPIRFNEDIIDQGFGYYALISPFVQAQIAEATYGAALMQINIRDLRKLKIRFPSIEDQASILHRLDHLTESTDQLSEHCANKLNAFEELKQSILHRAFRGELSGDGSTLNTNLMETAKA